MAAGFEVDPDQLDAQSGRFAQAAQNLDDAGLLSSAAAGVDLQGTVAAAAFAQAWDQLALGYQSVSHGAAVISQRLGQSATSYRDTDRATAAKLDRVKRDFGA